MKLHFTCLFKRPSILHIVISFPASRPDSPESQPMLWVLQMDLLSRAEAAFGSRNKAKQIYQPTFHDNGPFITNTPTLDGAFAQLSRNAAGFWPTVVYELAHETVHLLDPVVGITNCLEEGVAVEFSIRMSRDLTNHPMEPSPDSNYAIAHRLLMNLPSPLHESLSALRSQFGTLAAISSDHLALTFPSVSRDTCEKLASPFKPR